MSLLFIQLGCEQVDKEPIKNNQIYSPTPFISKISTSVPTPKPIAHLTDTPTPQNKHATFTPQAVTILTTPEPTKTQIPTKTPLPSFSKATPTKIAQITSTEIPRRKEKLEDDKENELIQTLESWINLVETGEWVEAAKRYAPNLYSSCNMNELKQEAANEISIPLAGKVIITNIAYEGNDAKVYIEIIDGLDFKYKSEHPNKWSYIEDKWLYNPDNPKMRCIEYQGGNPANAFDTTFKKFFEEYYQSLWDSVDFTSCNFDPSDFPTFVLAREEKVLTEGGTINAILHQHMPKLTNVYEYMIVGKNSYTYMDNNAITELKIEGDRDDGNFLTKVQLLGKSDFYSANPCSNLVNLVHALTIMKILAPYIHGEDFNVYRWFDISEEYTSDGNFFTFDGRRIFLAKLIDAIAEEDIGIMTATSYERCNPELKLLCPPLQTQWIISLDKSPGRSLPETGFHPAEYRNFFGSNVPVLLPTISNTSTPLPTPTSTAPPSPTPLPRPTALRGPQLLDLSVTHDAILRIGDHFSISLTASNPSRQGPIEAELNFVRPDGQYVNLKLDDLYRDCSPAECQFNQVFYIPDLPEWRLPGAYSFENILIIDRYTNTAATHYKLGTDIDIAPVNSIPNASTNHLLAFPSLILENDRGDLSIDLAIRSFSIRAPSNLAPGDSINIEISTSDPYEKGFIQGKVNFETPSHNIASILFNHLTTNCSWNSCVFSGPFVIPDHPDWRSSGTYKLKDIEISDGYTNTSTIYTDQNKIIGGNFQGTHSLPFSSLKLNKGIPELFGPEIRDLSVGLIDGDSSQNKIEIEMTIYDPYESNLIVGEIIFLKPDGFTIVTDLEDLNKNCNWTICDISGNIPIKNESDWRFQGTYSLHSISIIDGHTNTKREYLKNTRITGNGFKGSHTFTFPSFSLD